MALCTAWLFPLVIDLPRCCIWQWTISMATGIWEGFSTATIWSELAIDTPVVVSSPSSFQMAVYRRRIGKAHLESVQRFRGCPFAS